MTAFTAPHTRLSSQWLEPFLQFQKGHSCSVIGGLPSKEAKPAVTQYKLKNAENYDMTESLSLILQKIGASPCQNKKKKRTLFPIICWNMFSANPEHDLVDISFLNPHICCYTVSLFTVYLSSLLGFTSNYSLAQTLSSSILFMTIRDYFWPIKIIRSVYNFIKWLHLSTYITVKMICDCCNFTYFGNSSLSYQNLFLCSAIIWNAQESKDTCRGFLYVIYF